LGGRREEVGGKKEGKAGRWNERGVGRREEEMFSLTVMTLTVYMPVFKYQNQGIFNMTLFDGGPSLSYIDTCFWYPPKKDYFWNTTRSHFFQYDAF
jgi:hypothetical protein